MKWLILINVILSLLIIFSIKLSINKPLPEGVEKRQNKQKIPSALAVSYTFRLINKNLFKFKLII